MKGGEREGKGGRKEGEGRGRKRDGVCSCKNSLKYALALIMTADRDNVIKLIPSHLLLYVVYMCQKII